MANARSRTRARFSKTAEAAISKVPVWTTTPSFPSLTPGVAASYTLPVSAQGDLITMSWGGPGAQPGWVSFGTPSAQPSIVFSGGQTNTVTGVTLVATANGVGAPSVAANIPVVQVNPSPSWSAAPSFVGLTANSNSTQALPVTVSNGATITVSWVGPGTIGAGGTYPWITLQSGVAPTITFTNPPASTTLNNVTINALANGNTVSSAGVGTGTITVNAVAGWVVPQISLTQGSGTYDVAATGPLSLGYIAGGTYDANTLPSGASLSSIGILTVGSAVAGASSSTTFSYLEPGALPTLTLHPTSTATLPYMATVYPAEGAVPTGMSLTSVDDTNLRSSTLSTWPDGSAQVMVVAGSTAVTNGVSRAITLRPAVVSQTNLTTAAITSAVTSIAVNFGGGAQTLNTFSSPDFIWWQNSQVICARYRLSCGLGSMEAVIDIHAFAGGRAFVEVVIENGKLNPATATPSNAATFPAVQTYTNATVSVNGSVINGSGTTTPLSGDTLPTLGGAAFTWYSTGHLAFRAWYCSTWVGGDPGIAVTHDTASMQSHPLLFKIEKASTFNLASYATDAYTPWACLRQRAQMAGGGDHESIGPIPKWEARYLQSGNKDARNAVIQSGLALLSCNFHYRDSNTNLPISPAAMGGKSVSNSTFPRGGSGGFPFGDYSLDFHWDHAHNPSVGLMAFLCRPSPCFLEIAQKAASFAALCGTSNNLFGENHEVRGRAWHWRTGTQGAFLTPENVSANHAAMKTAWKTKLAENIAYFQTYDTSVEDKLNLMWGGDHDAGSPTYQFAVWQHDFLAPEVHKAAKAKIVAAANQAALDSFADWAVTRAVRWVNEQANGGWRYIGYVTTIGANNGGVGGVGQYDTWGAARASHMLDSPATVNGTWFTTGPGYDTGTSYITSGWAVENGNSGNMYVAPFWTVLASAVERGVAGAETAWNTVTTNVTNLTTFRDHAATDPRHHCYPRNK